MRISSKDDGVERKFSDKHNNLKNEEGNVETQIL